MANDDNTMVMMRTAVEVTMIMIKIGENYVI